MSLQNSNNANRAATREVAALFLKLGATAFGGPAAHLALMENEVVQRRGWVTRQEFLDLVAASNLIPGPNSTELAIHLGLRRAGWPGFAVAGACFVLPSFLMVLFLSWVYVRWGNIPEAGSVLYGLKPVIIAIIVQALYRLSRTALKCPFLVVLAVAAATANFLGVNEIMVLFIAGLLSMMAKYFDRLKPPGYTACLSFLGAIPALPAASAASSATPTLWAIGLFFLKVGSILFGSGYVLLAFLKADLVDRWHWLTETQLLDAIAVGQITPGPLFTTATFVGYLLSGIPGGIVATVAFSIPAFVFVALSGPVVPRLRQSALAGAFLDGVIVASLALMLVVTFYLSKAALLDATTLLLAAVSTVILFATKLNPSWLLLAGAVIGWLALSF